MLHPTMTVSVTKKSIEAEDVAVLELGDPAGGDLPPFGAGAHIDVDIAPGLTRQYSLCNNPEESRRYVIAVLKEKNSRGGSLRMHALQEGEQVRISAPLNHFALEPSATHSLLFAGGIGITPLLCMAERLDHINASFQMHYSARTRSRAAFYERIRTAPYAPYVQFHFSEGLLGQRLDLHSALASVTDATHIYVCGPAGYIGAVLQAASEAGVPDSNLHREYFAVDQPQVPIDADAFQVKIASSGVIIEVPGNRAITEVLAEHGVDIPVSCEQGICGTCVTHVLEGVPDHRDYFLTEFEHAAGDQFAPCCSRSKSPLLVLDL